MEFFQPNSPPKRKIRARCVVRSLANSTTAWSDEFEVLPSVGDTVQIGDGKRFSVIGVNHIKGLMGPEIEIELGQAGRSDVTPTEGGSSGGGYI